MGKVSVMVLIVISIMTVVISKGYCEDIKACVGKTGHPRTGRIVNDLSECNQNELPIIAPSDALRQQSEIIFGTSINNEMPSKEIDKTESFSEQYALSINKDGTGRGTVILSPSGVENNSAPIQKYNKGTLVVLTASPDKNSVFAGWKGHGCLGDGICVLTMSSDKRVTATFHKTNVSGTAVIRNTEKSVVPTISKKETAQHETKKDKEQTSEKSSQPQKPSEILYAVQAGAFRNASYAKALQINLARKGYYAYILTSKSELEGEFHKVLIGRFSDREDAKNLTYRILKMENLRTFVTSFETRQKELETKQ